RGRIAEATLTWDCGYAAPSPRMQYTASSFAQMLVGLFSWALWPRTHQPQIHGFFPGKKEFHSEVPDTVLDRALRPGANWLAWLASWSRIVQQGSIQAYLVYFFAVLVVLLFWR